MELLLKHVTKEFLKRLILCSSVYIIILGGIILEYEIMDVIIMKNPGDVDIWNANIIAAGCGRKLENAYQD